MNNLAIITRENLFGNLTLNQVIPDLISMGIKPTLFVAPDKPIKGMDAPELQEIAFLETELFREYVTPYLNANPLMADGQPLDGVNYTLDQLADIYDFDVIDVDHVNHAEFVDMLPRFDAAINIRSLSIYKDPLIDAMRDAGKPFYNLHPGILPEYKGLLIPFHAASAGEDLIGQSVHEIDSGIDTGAIIGVATMPLKSQPIIKTYAELSELGADLVVRTFAEYQAQGYNVKRAQSPSEKGIYKDLPTSQQMHEMESQGVYFADPQDVIDMYLNAYSRPDTPHHAGLFDALSRVIMPTAQKTDLTHS